MGSVDLHYDTSRGLFSVATAVIVKDEEEPRIGQAELFVDTGSNRTFIEKQKALEMGLRLEGREIELVGGIAGAGGSPVLHDVDIVLGGIGKVVHLERALVMIPPKVVKEQRKGPLKRTRTWEGEAVSLFGLDSLGALKGRVVVDLTGEPVGRIEWE